MAILSRTSALSWIAAAAALALLVLAVVAGLRAYHLSTRPPFMEQGFQVEHAWPPLGKDGALHLAGSSANMPLTRALVRAFTGQTPDVRVRLHPSIGSLGGIQATVDGVISLGLVSRPLTPAEARQLPVVIPYARGAVVVAAHPDVPRGSLSHSELVDIYRGVRARWSDSSPVAVLQRERGDSGHQAVNRVIPAFATVNDEAYRRRRWRVVYRDTDMAQALQSIRGAIGLLDIGAMTAHRLDLKALVVEGAVPNRSNVAQGRYPFYKDLVLVSRKPLEGVAAGLVDFFFSADGRRLIEAKGYVPLPRSTP